MSKFEVFVAAVDDLLTRFNVGGVEHDPAITEFVITELIDELQERLTAVRNLIVARTREEP
jgi:hypothetical protein